MALNPSATPRPLYGNGGLFHYWQNDLISMVTTGGSELMQWIPARAVRDWNQTVASLIWTAPEGFTGEDTYIDFLLAAGGIPSECDFAPGGGQFGVVEYVHSMNRVSIKSDPYNWKHNGGMRLFEQQPIYTLRGDDPANLGQALTSDYDWGIALLAQELETHLNWNLIYGDDALAGSIARGVYSGLNSVVSTGWVANRTTVGRADFSDPLMISGTSLSTPEQILRTLKSAVRFQRQRMEARGHVASGDDMVIAMSPAHWQYLADAIAAGSMLGYVPANFVIQINPQDVLSKQDAIFQSKTLMIDGRPVPIKTEIQLGKSVTLDDNTPGVLGDIWILVKKFRNYAILEHLYLDWRVIQAEEPQNIAQKPFISADGKIRTVMVEESGGICYWLGMDLNGMLMSRANQFQTKITDVAIAINSEFEIETSDFTHPDFYAFNGREGGQGDVLLDGYSTRAP